eukprot:1902075-Alexandrium_andersonii.AAC.1
MRVFAHSRACVRARGCAHARAFLAKAPQTRAGGSDLGSRLLLASGSGKEWLAIRGRPLQCNRVRNVLGNFPVAKHSALS